MNNLIISELKKKFNEEYSCFYEKLDKEIKKDANEKEVYKRLASVIKYNNEIYLLNNFYSAISDFMFFESFANLDEKILDFYLKADNMIQLLSEEQSNGNGENLSDLTGLTNLIKNCYEYHTLFKKEND